MDITVSQPFVADVLQYTDGRNTGGLQVIKRHPNWKPEQTVEEYSLWVRATDDTKGRPIAKAKVSLFHWVSGTGNFMLQEPSPWYTDDLGVVKVSGLRCSGKSEFCVEREGFQTESFKFLPFPGQKIVRAVHLIASAKAKEK
jgi:hypothetical protein